MHYTYDRDIDFLYEDTRMPDKVWSKYQAARNSIVGSLVKSGQRYSYEKRKAAERKEKDKEKFLAKVRKQNARLAKEAQKAAEEYKKQKEEKFKSIESKRIRRFQGTKSKIPGSPLDVKHRIRNPEAKRRVAALYRKYREKDNVNEFFNYVYHKILIEEALNFYY